ncbi:MAG: cell division protein FtsZ, partial [Bacteroidales bacterium]|nr:cell division protein FtsZ [Bacteroidales bacterium]
MGDDIINFDLPIINQSIIKVIGVGGGGGNAVNYMHSMGIKDVDFVLCNTDAQALVNSPVEFKVQLGATLTEGRGAGNKPEIGRQAAIESLQQIVSLLQKNTKMVFITAGMGGGTGTGAAPIIAKAAKELGILTVAIVTIPFRTEGRKRMMQAIEGIRNISQHVDSLLVINNEKLLEVYGNLKLTEAFAKADDVLATAAKGIAEIITVHGYINVDFADVETVMYNSGVALMGSGRANGQNRALEAVKQALESPQRHTSPAGAGHHRSQEGVGGPGLGGAGD